MRKFSLLIAILFASFAAIAQDQTIKGLQATAEKKLDDDTTHKEGWKRGGFVSLGIGQGSSSNWAAGAETFSMSLSGTATLYSNYKHNKFNWKNSLDLGYALVNTTSQGTRKTDDKIDLYSKATHDVSKTWSIGAVGNFRTQFSSGFDYNYLGKDLERRTSDFMAPGFLVLAPGFDWHPSSYFSIFLSPVSARFVLVTNDPKSYYFENGVIPDSVAETPDFETPLSVLYGVDPARKVRSEVGAFASANFAKEIAKNVAFKSRLDLYSNYLGTYNFAVTGPDQLAITKVGATPQKVDVFWTNLLLMKVNKFLNVSFSMDIIYDDDVRQFGTNNNSAATQFRSQLTVGFSTKL
jgi:hypothetical protein